MILPSFTEQQILNELVADRKVVANQAKKIASKAIAMQKKAGQGEHGKLQFIPSEFTTSRLHNNWIISVVMNMAHNANWFHEAACRIESEHGTKDYYILRGMMNRKPYFIKITSHAMKRFNQREIGEVLNLPTDFDSGSLAPIVIRKSEIITWMLIKNPKELKEALASEDRHLMPTLFYTYYGCYLGYHTEQGNVVFKTFLSNDKKLRKYEEQVAKQLCKIAHVGMNEKLYDKDFREHFFDKPFMLPKESEEKFVLEFKNKYRLLP